jgi:chromosomal replication initiation ATPase DnaA
MARRFSYVTGSGKQKAAKAERRSRFDEIIADVAKHYGLRVADLVGRRRARRFALPRHVAMLLMYESSPFTTLTDIADVFDRDHSTVIVSLRRVRDAAKADIEIHEDILELRRTLDIKERSA